MSRGRKATERYLAREGKPSEPVFNPFPKVVLIPSFRRQRLLAGSFASRRAEQQGGNRATRRRNGQRTDYARLLATAPIETAGRQLSTARNIPRYIRRRYARLIAKEQR